MTSKMFLKVKTFLVEFSSTTTVHGVNYFSDRERHWIERVFWVVAFLVSMSACFILVHDTYTKWQSSPIIVTQDDKFTSNSEIPFPAVTICSASKIKAENSFNLTRLHDKLIKVGVDIIFNSENFTSKDFKFDASELKAMNMGDEELLLVEVIHYICELTLNSADYIENKLSPRKVVDTLKIYAFDVDDIFAYVRLKNAPRDKLFKRVLTEEGLCFTFNSLRNVDIFKMESIADDYRPYESELNGIEWNPEDGFEGIMDKKLSPIRAFFSKPRDGLELTLNHEVDVTPAGCPSSDEKMKIVIHSPADFPQLSHKVVSVPTSGELVIGVKPVMMTTTPELAKYSVETRQCYFNSDRSLKFFKFYSQANCEFECLTNFTLLACDCVRVAMPRDNATEICSLAKVRCVETAATILNSKNLDDLGDWTDEDLMTNFNASSEKLEQLLLHSCDCLPPCVSLHYEITVLPIHGDDNARSEANSNWTESKVMIYFEDSQFLKTKRSEIYGWAAFIANCGGLLGLFMGVSILSIIEIVYFATLRLACSLKSSHIADEEATVEHKKVPIFKKISQAELIDWDKF